MNSYEKRPRYIVLVQSVCLAVGTVWFTISVAAIFATAVFPITWRSAIIERSRKDARIMRHHRVPKHPYPNHEASLVCQVDSYCISLNEKSELEDPRHSSKAMAPVVHSDGPAAPQRQATVACVLEADEDQVASDSPSEPRSASASPVPSEQRSTGSSKSGVFARLPHILHLKSKKSGNDGHLFGSGRNTKSRSPSPIRRLFPKSEPEEPADAHGRIPYVRNPENVERLTTTFINPFKINTKRTRRDSTASTPERPSANMPSSPEATSPRRNSDDGPLQSIAMRMKHVVRPRAVSSATHRPSPPHRTFSASSSSSVSSHSSHRSTSSAERPRRTQPYGPPYYAAPPTACPKSRRSSGARMSVDVRPPINEEVEPEEQGQSTAVEGENALGLALCHREHHQK